MVGGYPLVPLCERAVCDRFFDARLDFAVAYVASSHEKVEADQTIVCEYVSITLFPCREQQPRHPRLIITELLATDLR